MLAFAHIQKTAGITVAWILRRSFGLRHCEVEPWRDFAGKRYYATAYSAADHARVLRIYGKLESIGGHHVKPHSDLLDVYPETRFYTFVRDPLRRTASHFQHMVQKMGYRQSCERWLEDERFHNLQTKHLAGVDDLEAAKRILRDRCFFVGLVERFDESLVLLHSRARVSQLDIRYRPENVASDASIARRLLDEAPTRNLIEDVNRTDSALVDWVEAELYPEQCRDFGPELDDRAAAVRDRRPPRRYNAKAFFSRAAKSLVMAPLARRARSRTTVERD